LKRKIAKIAVFVIILATYVAFLLWSIATYNAWIAAKIAEYEQFGISRDFIDLPGFSSFWYGQASLWLGVAVAIVEISILASFRKPKVKATSVATTSVLAIFARAWWQH
jgi:hypothetical protein